METLHLIISTIYDWFKYFRGPEWLLPIIAAAIAGMYLSRKLNSLREKMRKDFEEDFTKLIGAFRSDIHKAVTGANKSLLDGAKRARQVVEATQSQQQKKLDFATKAARNAEAASSNLDTGNKEREDLDPEVINWGEVSAGWVDVWDWIKSLRDEAIEVSKGRAKGHLRELDLRSPVDVILKLYNYGYFEDRASDLALEMAAIYLKHRGRGRVNRNTLKQFRELQQQWNSI